LFSLIVSTAEKRTKRIPQPAQEKGANGKGLVATDFLLLLWAFALRRCLYSTSVVLPTAQEPHSEQAYIGM